MGGSGCVLFCVCMCAYGLGISCERMHRARVSHPHLERHRQAGGGRGHQVARQVDEHHVVLVAEHLLDARQHATGAATAGGAHTHAPVLGGSVVLGPKEEPAGELNAASHGLREARDLCVLVRLIDRRVCTIGWMDGWMNGWKENGRSDQDGLT